jgi:hypothetical protein
LFDFPGAPFHHLGVAGTLSGDTSFSAGASAGLRHLKFREGGTMTMQAGEFEALAQQVDAVARETAELRGAVRRSRSIRVFLLLCVMGFVGVFGWLFYKMGLEVQDKSYLDQLSMKAQERFAKNNDEYLKQVQLLVNNASPELSKAFMEQARQDMPKFMDAAGRERDRFLDEIQGKMEVMVNDHYDKLLEKHQDLIKREFPNVSDQVQVRMVKNLQTAMEKLVKKYYIEELKTQINTLYQSWDEFAMADQPMPGMNYEEEFMDKLLELLRVKLASTEALGQR